MKTIYNNKKIRIFSLGLVLAGIVSLGCFMQSCSNDDEPIDSLSSSDAIIINSSEFEEYIIAGADFYQSLKIFEKELAKVNFASLETVIEDGREVIYLPEAIRSLNIGQKMTLMNQQKEALSRKYPQLLNQKRNDLAKYIKNSIKQSIRVNDFFLSTEMNIYQPTMKGMSVEKFDTMAELMDYLVDWLSNPKNVELTCFMFKDGSFLVMKDDRNTTTESYWPGNDITTNNNKHYYGGLEISGFVHTHPNNSHSNPGPADYSVKNRYPHSNHYIFYEIGFWKY